ncbi:mitochondrial carrier protein [Diplonema papillatum]|nr:mitochondrial carrier protein [Diplonema papillatum]
MVRAAPPCEKQGTDAVVPRKRVKSETALVFTAGLVSGVVQAVIFNPYDKALYLSVTAHRPFLRWENFSRPFHGLAQAVVQRVASGGLYFVLQREIQHKLFSESEADHSSNLENFSVGALAGALNGVLLNPMSAARYHAWGTDTTKFGVAAREMWQHGGCRAFTKGTGTTVLRDLMFGIIYETARHPLAHCVPGVDLSLPANLVAAGSATLFSSPLNYIRLRQYGHHPAMPHPRALDIVRDLLEDSLYDHERGQTRTAFQRLSHMQDRLRIGWATARVAVGMMVGQAIFDLTLERLEAVPVV